MDVHARAIPTGRASAVWIVLAIRPPHLRHRKNTRAVVEVTQVEAERVFNNAKPYTADLNSNKPWAKEPTGKSNWPLINERMNKWRLKRSRNRASKIRTIWHESVGKLILWLVSIIPTLFESKKVMRINLLSAENRSFVPIIVYESREKIILVMEYASGGELYDYLNRMKRIPESQARAIFRQIVSAVHFLHKVNSSINHLLTQWCCFSFS